MALSDSELDQKYKKIMAETAVAKHEHTQFVKEQDAIKLAEQYRHFIGARDIDGRVITYDAILRWARRIDRRFICLFCGQEPLSAGEFRWCKRCKEYKGVMPYFYNFSGG